MSISQNKPRSRKMLDIPAPLLKMVGEIAHLEGTSVADQIRHFIRQGIQNYAATRNTLDNITRPKPPRPA